MIDSQKSLLFLGSLAAAGCEILFGLSYVFSKQAASESGVSALLGWRFFVAIAAMSLFFLRYFIKGLDAQFSRFSFPMRQYRE